MSINTEIGYFMIHFTDTFTAVDSHIDVSMDSLLTTASSSIQP